MIVGRKAHGLSFQVNYVDPRMFILFRPGQSKASAIATKTSALEEKLTVKSNGIETKDPVLRPNLRICPLIAALAVHHAGAAVSHSTHLLSPVEPIRASGARRLAALPRRPRASRRSAPNCHLGRTANAMPGIITRSKPWGSPRQQLPRLRPDRSHLFLGR
jgi:hypothetical protein